MLPDAAPGGIHVHHIGIRQLFQGQFLPQGTPAEQQPMRAQHIFSVRTVVHDASRHQYTRAHGHEQRSCRVAADGKAGQEHGHTDRFDQQLVAMGSADVEASIDHGSRSKTASSAT